MSCRASLSTAARATLISSAHLLNAKVMFLHYISASSMVLFSLIRIFLSVILISCFFLYWKCLRNTSAKRPYELPCSSASFLISSTFSLAILTFRGTSSHVRKWSHFMTGSSQKGQSLRFLGVGWCIFACHLNSSRGLHSFNIAFLKVHLLSL